MTLANDQYMVTIQVEDLPLPEHYRILHQPEVPPTKIPRNSLVPGELHYICPAISVWVL